MLNPKQLHLISTFFSHVDDIVYLQDCMLFAAISAGLTCLHLFPSEKGKNRQNRCVSGILGGRAI